MNRTLLLFCLLCLLFTKASAQSFEEYKRQQQAKYSGYVKKKTEEFRAYRDCVNAEYAEYMRRTWTREEVQPAKPLPKRPEPPQPEVRKPYDIPQFDAIPFGNVLDAKVPNIPKPEPIIPIDELDRLVFSAPEVEAKPLPLAELKPVPLPEVKQDPVPDKKPITVPDIKPVPVPDVVSAPKQEPKQEPKDEPNEEPKPEPPTVKLENFTFKWCGQSWNVPLGKQHIFRLRSTKESDVADAWQMLSGAKYAGVVAACLRIRDKYQLPDWGYLRFLEAMAEAFMPGMQNEARLLEMFILVQSGYQVRIARSDGRLFLLVPSSGEICEYSYIKIGGRAYYVTDKGSRSGAYYIFERDFPREQPFAWQMSKLPVIASEGKVRSLKGQRYPDVNATVNVNKGLMAFMNEYPRCNDWNLYALASLSEQVKESLYPALNQHIKGKSKYEAVGILLDFVQTAFDYQTDDKQFGEERPLFGDETLYYPYCDCEDRSILFSILVRELLNLDVVLLNYPNHLATAVCIGENVEGDYLILDGRRYIVCDPTYIGARVGESMSSYKNVKATIVRL